MKQYYERSYPESRVSFFRPHNSDGERIPYPYTYPDTIDSGIMQRMKVEVVAVYARDKEK